MSFEEDDAMLVLAVPDIDVAELVDVRSRPAVVHVDVGHEELYDEPSMALPI